MLNPAWPKRPDAIFNSIRWLGIGDLHEPSSGTTLNRGIGPLWDGNTGRYPTWIKSSMVRPTSQVLLLVERSYTEEAQCTNWNLGYQVNNPAGRMWDPSAFYGYPLLHTNNAMRGSSTSSTVVTGKQVVNNYLFCDTHVQLMRQAEQIDQTQL